jgi:hypothetical protein
VIVEAALLECVRPCRRTLSQGFLWVHGLLRALISIPLGI